ncbi:hypothetical protein [Pontibacter mangrovi]|uniref:Glycosyltransferase family 61 protein n=1 Tax=Pontibacter mangrovi TaxID=2589816 RepID=A0A501W4C4_9BACT|nr:hypothetical protein [Pontibacter mangrovi]TPE43495.1 hypothetical protein FJM65_12085 [Pontibacter mangrovi]
MDVVNSISNYTKPAYPLLYKPHKRPFLKRLKRRLAGSFSYGTPEFFIRENSYARLKQLKYCLKDYVLRKPYKEIDYRLEFQQELTFVLPFAYWHHVNGTLQKTISSRYTKELYFFSDNHEEKYETRLDRLPEDSYEIPNMFHCLTMSFDKWARVPLKAHYQNDLFVFEKPLLIIANKYNTEWGNGPVNFFSVAMLEQIIHKFRHKYQIVYNRPGPNYIVMDNSAILELKEEAFLRKYYPDVLMAEDLYQANRAAVNNYNHFQLMLYANCGRFLSVHGGTAALASYFGGKNIILSRRGHEHRLKEFKHIFPALSGAEIFHAKNEAQVLTFLDSQF